MLGNDINRSWRLKAESRCLVLENKRRELKNIAKPTEGSEHIQIVRPDNIPRKNGLISQQDAIVKVEVFQNVKRGLTFEKKQIWNKRIPKLKNSKVEGKRSI